VSPHPLEFHPLLLDRLHLKLLLRPELPLRNLLLLLKPHLEPLQSRSLSDQEAVSSVPSAETELKKEVNNATPLLSLVAVPDNALSKSLENVERKRTTLARLPRNAKLELELLPVLLERTRPMEKDVEESSLERHANLVFANKLFNLVFLLSLFLHWR